MNQKLSLAATICVYIGMIGGAVISIYGLLELGKTISYSWLYQDMVQQTVREMVKGSALK